MINLKTPHEIELMARAGHVLASVLDDLKAACRPGIRTIELDRLAAERIRRAGATPGFLGYHDYPNTLCVSINDEVVHGIPGSRRIEKGDLVSLDLGLVLDGFWADSGLSVTMGKVDARTERLLTVTREALDLGVEKARPGNRLGDISAAIQDHVEAASFSVVKQFVGHGIGRRMHEEPQVPNFGSLGTGPELKPGMTLAIEPMVNAGSEEVFIRPDGWTVVTADGSISAYFEHTVAVTPAGPLVLTQRRDQHKLGLKSA